MSTMTASKPYPQANGETLKEQTCILGLSAPPSFEMTKVELFSRVVDVAGELRQFDIQIGELNIRGSNYPDVYLIRVDTGRVERGRDRYDERPLGKTIQAAHLIADELLEDRGLKVVDYYSSWPSMEILAEAKSPKWKTT